MVTRWVGGVLGACFVLGCGSSSSTPSSGGSSGTSGSSAGNAGGSNDGGVPNAGSAGVASGGSSGGASGGGITGLDLDATCRERSTNHIAGTRIVYRTLVTPEGDKAYNGFYDKQLGIDCRPSVGKDGKDRCYPVDIYRPARADLFTDTACTDAVYPLYESCDPPEVLALYVPAADECALGTTTHYAVGQAYPAGSPVFVKAEDGSCVSAPEGTVSEGYGLFHKGAEVDPSLYAETPISIRPGTARIARRVATGADGSLLVLGYFDSELGADCQFLDLKSGKEACLARGGLNVAAGYADETCSVGLVSLSTSCGRTPVPYNAQSSSSQCAGQGWTEVTTGTPFTGSAHQAADAACVLGADTPPDTRYFLSAEVPEAELPTVERSVFDGDPGRLKPMYRTAADGGCTFDDWWDSELDVPCAFLRVGDTYRCLPSETDGSPVGFTVSGYKDAGCTQPLSVQQLDPTCNPSNVPKYVVEIDYSDRCNRTVTSVKKLGAIHQAADFPIWQGSPLSCTPYGAAANNVFAELGEALDLGSFMQATEDPL